MEAGAHLEPDFGCPCSAFPYYGLNAIRIEKADVPEFLQYQDTVLEQKTESEEQCLDLEDLWFRARYKAETDAFELVFQPYEGKPFALGPDAEDFANLISLQRSEFQRAIDALDS